MVDFAAWTAQENRRLLIADLLPIISGTETPTRIGSQTYVARPPRPMEVVTHVQPASTTGNADITADRSDTPIAALLIHCDSQAEDTTRDIAKYSIGAFDGANQWVVCISSQHGQGTSNTFVRSATDAVVMVMTTSSGAVRSEASGVALIPGGVRLNWSVVAGEDTVVMAVLFFDPRGRAVVGTYDPHQTVNSSITVTTGLPANDVLISVPSQFTAFADSPVANAHIGMGFATRSDGNQRFSGWMSFDAQANAVPFTWRLDYSCGVDNSGSQSHFDVSGLAGGSFSVTTRNAAPNAAARVGYLALHMPETEATCDNLTVPTSTGAQNVTDPSFRTSALLCMPTLCGATNASDAQAETWAVGLATENGATTMGCSEEDNADTTNSSSWHVDGELVAKEEDADPPTLEATFQPRETGGFTLTWSQVDANTHVWNYLALGHSDEWWLYEGRLIDDVEIERRMGGFSGSSLEGRGDGGANGGMIRLANPDGDLDEWIEYAWTGQPVTLRYGDPSWLYEELQVVFRGSVMTVEADDESIRIALRDRSEELANPIQSVIEERGPNLGDRKPICYGYPKNITPVVTDPDSTPEYRIHEGGTVEDVAVARYKNQEAFTSPSITKRNQFGDFELASDPQGIVTVDAKGIQDSGTWVELPGHALQHMLTRKISDTIGLAQGGTANTITLAEDASDENDAYNGKTIRKTVFSETGEGDEEEKTITDYVGSTRVATVDTNWSDNPVAGDGYRISSASMQAGPLTTDDLDTDAFDQLDTDLPYQIGAYINDGRSAAEAIESIVGPGAWYGWTREGKLTVGVIVDPSGETADLELDEGDAWDVLHIQQDAVPVYKLRVGYDLNYSVERSGASGDIDPSRQAYVTRDYRYAIQEDVGIRDDYPEARSIAVPTLYTDRSDAQTETARLFTLVSAQRYWYDVQAFAKPMQVDLGDIVQLTRDRYGLDSGKNLVVIGILEFPLQGRTRLTLWG